MATARRFGVEEFAASRKDSLFFDAASRRKEVQAAKSVVEEVRRRVTQLRSAQTKAESEKEKEEKLEKARAAAWAWYQHGKGGKARLSSSSSSSSGASTITFRSGELGHKSSRFKTEALKTSVPLTSPSVQSDRRWRESGQSWDFSSVSGAGTSSLFDSYELDSVSKRIDSAFNWEGSTIPTQTTGPTSRPGFNTGQSSVAKPAIGMPPSGYPSPPSAPHAPQVISDVHLSQGTNRSPKVTRSSSHRMQFPRCLCSSISDVVTHEEMALGVDIAKCECQKNRGSQWAGSGWSFRRITRAIQEFIYLPDSEYHPQQEHHERRRARLHLHHHHHQHDHHEYHHHLHYQIKLRDGVHHGNYFTTYPGKQNPSVEVLKEKRHPSVPRLGPKRPPEVSVRFFGQTVKVMRQ